LTDATKVNDRARAGVPSGHRELDTQPTPV